MLYRCRAWPLCGRVVLMMGHATAHGSAIACHTTQYATVRGFVWPGVSPLGLAAADGRPLAEDTGLVSRWWRCAAGHEARGEAEDSPSACELHAEVSWALVAGISRVLL